MDKPGDLGTERTRILVVDDDPVHARIAARIARFGGFEVRECHGAIEASGIARTWRPGLVIADMVMSEMDGSEFCVVLKSDPETRDIPVLFVSAHDTDEGEALRRFCGAAEFLGKPFTAVKLLRAIRRLLGGVVEVAAPRVTESLACSGVSGRR